MVGAAKHYDAGCPVVGAFLQQAAQLVVGQAFTHAGYEYQLAAVHPLVDVFRLVDVDLGYVVVKSAAATDKLYCGKALQF